jgi:hypothetical protein
VADGSPWRNVVKVTGPHAGRGGYLGPDTSRRAKWWVLDLDCGHTTERSVRYGPRKDGYPRQRGGTQRRSLNDVLPAPKRVQCHFC